MKCRVTVTGHAVGHVMLDVADGETYSDVASRIKDVDVIWECIVKECEVVAIEKENGHEQVAQIRGRTG